MVIARNFIFITSALLLTSGAALAQEACSTYTVAPGDNLRYIARNAYGDADLYRVIYDANVAAIGETVDLIEIGVELAIPCDPRVAAVETAPAETETAIVETATAETAVDDASVAPAAATQDATVTSVSAPTEPAPAEPVLKPISFVTGNGYAPFADETLPGGGMFTQLVEMAVFRADPAIAYNLTYINDWQAHIDALLPSGAYDLSFPWIRPNCESTEMLSPGDQSRCDDFVFSGPLYEIVDGFFAMRQSGLAAASKYSDFEGKRICRPEGHTTGVLEAAGLSVPIITLVRPTEVTDCFRALVAGEVDLVSIDAEVGDSAIAQLGIAADVEQNPQLVSLLSLHVIAHKSNARAIDMIGKLDTGVIEMYQSGEWYDIVSSALTQTSLQQ
jgi:polar amino acid transport system substrate-binding protein